MVAQEAGKLDGRCCSNLQVRTAWTRHSSEVGETIGKFISKAKYNILTGLGVETTTTPTKKRRDLLMICLGLHNWKAGAGIQGKEKEGTESVHKSHR